MDNGGDILRLCRLCLVKDDVNIPIFEEQGDIRQIFLKISSCLPVKVSREDKLPKKICDGCSYKLDMLYEFWNTTANAEKQLLSWLGEAGMNAKMADGTISAVAQQIKPVETFVKQEAIDPSDVHADDNDDDKSYMFQQKFAVEEAGPSATVTSNEEEPPPKRARRTAAVKAQIAMDPESDDDDDSGEPITKVEDESEESEGDDHEPPFVDVPSTSADDQPGPSGVGKDGVEAPLPTTGRKNPSLVQIGLTCTLCNKTYPTQDKFRRHFRNHQERKFFCDMCSFKTLYKSALESHKKAVHIKEDVYNCELCDKVFTNPWCLKSHMGNVHLKDYKFNCDKCGRGFYQKNQLITHDENVHQGIRHACTVCNKIFTTKAGLRLHSFAHDPSKKKMECPVCLKEVSRRTYKVHQRKHSGDETVGMHVCEICGKAVTSSAVKGHMRTHTGEKPYSCDICGKSLASSQILVTHKRTHTKERPFICQVCNKAFTQKPALNVHMRYHTGEKPYSCDVCSKKFITKTLLKAHRCQGPSSPT